MMKSVLIFCLMTGLLATSASAREWFVQQADPNASDTADGSADQRSVARSFTSSVPNSNHSHAKCANPGKMWRAQGQ